MNEDDDKDFAEGFDPEAATTAAPIETPPETAAPTTEQPPAPAPEYVQLTKEQFASLTAAAEKTASLEAQMSKAFGTIGNMQQHMNQLRADTSKTTTIELPEDVVSEMEESFPEIAGTVRKSLEKVVKGIRVSTNAPAAPSVDPDEVRQIAERIAVKNELDALEDAYPTWRDIVGVVDSEGRAPADNPFRKWLSTQDAKYAERVNNTNSARVIAGAIERFNASLKKPAAPASPPRNDRIRAAVQPKSAGGQPAPTKTDDDEFHAGFVSG